jgi:DNA-binding Lrp family transcriptional regulator
MKRIINRQITLKPQDLLVALKLALPGQKPAPYADLAEALGMSASEAHARVGRLKVARLL